MKKLYLLLALSFGATQIYSQTLFTYGTDAVSKEEFLRAYNKNKTAVENKEQSLKEYLDLYSKFKLKVKAAKVLKLDTLPQLKLDMQNFREQVEEGYMNDEKGVNTLVDEALSRAQKDIHIMHFFVPIAADAQPADTIKAYKAIEDVYAALKSGNNNYDELTKQHAPVKKTDIGFITTFSIPYEYENIVYNLKPGESGKPFRTKSGWHIFTNIEERKAAGKWKIAQILLAIPPNADSATVKKIEHKADSLYNRLIAGDDFAATAKKYSEDKLTYQMGGEMPEFGTGKFSPLFEAKVFALKDTGSISKPIFAGDGYHIVKKLDQATIPTDKSDELYIYNLKQKVLQDSRMASVKEKFVKDILVKTNYKKNEAVKDADLYRYADSVIKNKRVTKYPISDKAVLLFANGKNTGADWLNFALNFRQNSETGKETNKEIFDKFVASSALTYYRKHLEEYNTEFKYQMQEFKEGNMLFEIMERNVWGKAAADSAGLQKYYNQHKDKYKWTASATVIMFNCGSEKAANEAIEELNKGKDWQKITEDSDGKVQADSGRYEIAQLQIPAETTLKAGLITSPVVNSADNTAGFIKVLTIFPDNQQRTFEEARGLVINDYQNYLEEQWIKQLKIKYPVKVNEPLFQSLLK